MTNLHADDFIQQPQRHQSIRPRWIHRQRFASGLGPVEIILRTDRDSAPDKEMLEMASMLLAFMTSNPTRISNIVHSRYRQLCSTDPSWLTEMKVPIGLSEIAIWDYIVKPHSLIVDKFSTELRAQVQIHPQWDEEHDIRLDVANGRITSINDSPVQPH